MKYSLRTVPFALMALATIGLRIPSHAAAVASTTATPTTTVLFSDNFTKDKALSPAWTFGLPQEQPDWVNTNNTWLWPTPPLGSTISPLSFGANGVTLTCQRDPGTSFWWGAAFTTTQGFDVPVGGHLEIDTTVYSMNCPDGFSECVWERFYGSTTSRAEWDNPETDWPTGYHVSTHNAHGGVFETNGTIYNNPFSITKPHIYTTLIYTDHAVFEVDGSTVFTASGKVASTTGSLPCTVYNSEGIHVILDAWADSAILAGQPGAPTGTASMTVQGVTVESVVP